MRMSTFANDVLLMGTLRDNLHQLSDADRKLAEIIIRETAARLKESPWYWHQFRGFFQSTPAPDLV